jgi:hypothetical protein
VSLEPLVAAVVVVVLWDLLPRPDDQTARLIQPERDRDRPPDSLSYLRSVILLV